MHVPQIKKLCDFFCVDRTDYKGKDNLVDALLDFLGEPGEEKMKGTSVQPNRGKKGQAKKSEDAEDDEGEADNHGYDDVDDDKLTNPVFDSDGMPTDDTLRKWVRAYVRCHNMKTSSVKDALAIASAKFEKDISSQKTRLKELLTEEI
jgi:hypothetical protein